MCCKDCAYLSLKTNKLWICSFLKIKYPNAPGKYLKNENERACVYLRKKEK